jgi:very-short-patch-repair endonuclease
MSYGNQRDHLLLDRHQVKELLVALRDCSIQPSPTRQSRAEHLAELLKACDSELERDWLRFIDSQGLHLPSHAQKRIVECGTKPDFLYLSGSPTVAVYIDGPPHDFPSRQNRDAAQDFELLSRGWVVHRFHHEGDWKKIISENPSVYGSVE